MPHDAEMNDLPPVALRTADLLAAGLDDRFLRRRAEKGEITRVVRGRYIGSDVWNSLDDRERYCLRIRETVRGLNANVVVSHQSAAAFWAFPVLDRWPTAVEVLDPARSQFGRTRTLVRRPGGNTADVVTSGDIRVTSAARTAVDVALTSDFVVAVMVFDQGLRAGLFDVGQPAALLEQRRDAQRWRAASLALRMASPLAESPGESISRAMIHCLGFPAPGLQETFADRRGVIGRVDFWWPETGLVGEFDGAAKYLDPVLRNGRTADQVVLAEKKRADRLRALPHVRDVVRWDYATARNAERLASVLLGAGLRQQKTRFRQMKIA